MGYQSWQHSECRRHSTTIPLHLEKEKGEEGEKEEEEGEEKEEEEEEGD